MSFFSSSKKLSVALLIVIMEIGPALQPVSTNIRRATTYCKAAKNVASSTENDSRRKNRVCVCGSTNIDLITSQGPRFPRPGETISFNQFEQCFGGKGANQAVQAARCGAKTKMIAKVGDDNFGQAMTDNFKECGVDTSYVSVASGAPSGCALITVAENTNTIVIVPGANAKLSPEDIPIKQENDVLLCQMEVPVETSLEAMRQCSGIKIVNTAPIPSGGVPDSFLQAADIVCANEVELELMTSIPADTIISATNSAKALIAKKSLDHTVVVATLGSNGALIVGNYGPTIHIPAITDITVVDTTGAGDSFLGALAAFLAQNFPLVLAVFLANLTAALAVQRPTTQPSYPNVDELVISYPQVFASSAVTGLLDFVGNQKEELGFSLDLNQASSPGATTDVPKEEEVVILRLNADGSLSPFSSPP